MEIAVLQVNKFCIHIQEQEVIPRGIRGGRIRLLYADPIWDGLRKTVVFRGCTTKDVISDESVVEIPGEVVAVPMGNLLVGVYGVDDANNLVVPTLWVNLGPIQPAADPSGDASTEPSLPVWAQLQAMIGDLAGLNTQTKESLVAALNELYARSGGSADPEEVGRLVEEYLAANPPSSDADVDLTGYATEDYVDNAVTPMLCSKNRLKYKEATTAKSVVYTPKMDGRISIAGTAANSSGYLIFGECELEAGTYTVSFEGTFTTKGPMYLLLNGTASNSTNVSAITASNTTKTVEITTPGYYALAMYVISGITYEMDGTVQIEAGNTATKHEPYYRYPQTEADIFSVAGKSYLAIGDSLTCGYSGDNERIPMPYPELVGKLLNLGTVTNNGISGTTITNDPSFFENPMSSDARIAALPNADIISIMGMTNDYNYGCPLGEIGAAETTFYGGYQKLIEAVVSSNPKAFVFLIAPPITRGYASENKAGITAKQYHDAILEIGAYYGLPVLDMTKSGLSELNRAAWCIDTTHFGQEYILTVFAPAVAGFLKK